MLRTYRRVLRFRFAIKTTGRHVEQVQALVRQLALRRALYWLQHASPAAHQALDKWHLLLVDPHLRDDDELVQFALDLLADQWIEPAHVALLSKLHELRADDKATACCHASLADVLADVLEPPTTDASYATLRSWSKRKLCALIVHDFRQAGVTHIATADVGNAFDRLCTVKIRSLPYEWQRVGRSFVAVPQRAGELREFAPLHTHAGFVAVHRSLLQASSGDPHAAALRACLNRFTPRATFLCGHALSPQAPHLFATRLVEPNERTVSLPTIGTRLSATAQIVLQSDNNNDDAVDDDVVAQLEQSFDDNGTAQRLALLRLPTTSADLTRFNPRSTDRMPVAAQQIVYPNSFVGEQRRGAKRAREIEKVDLTQ